MDISSVYIFYVEIFTILLEVMTRALVETYLSKCGMCELVYYELQGSGGSGRQYWAGTIWEVDIKPPFGRRGDNYVRIKGEEICAEGSYHDPEEKILNTGEILYVQVLTLQQSSRLFATRGVIQDDEDDLEADTSDEEENHMDEDEQEDDEEQQEAEEGEEEQTDGDGSEDEDSGMEESAVEEEDEGHYSEYEIVLSSDEDEKKMEE